MNVLGFGSLIAPLSIDDFFTRYFEQAPFHLTCRPASLYDPIFSSDAIEYVITGACNNRASGPELLRSGTANKLGDAASTAREFAAGTTIRVHHVQQYWKPAYDLCQSLTGALGFPVTINLYCTPPNARGLAKHFDYHDVLILQLQGAKQWRVSSPAVEYPIRETPAVGFDSTPQDWEWPRLARTAETTSLLNLELQPGDLLYIPRGFAHEAWTEDRMSAHLTVALHPFTWTQLAGVALRAFAAGAPELRRAVSFSDTDHLRETLRRFADTADFAGAHALLLQALARSTGHSGDGALAEQAAPESIQLESELEVRAGLAPIAFSANGQACVAFRESTVSQDLAAMPALLQIVRERAFRVAELPGLPDRDKLRLCRQLFRLGLLRICR